MPSALCEVPSYREECEVCPQIRGWAPSAGVGIGTQSQTGASPTLNMYGMSPEEHNNNKLAQSTVNWFNREINLLSYRDPGAVKMVKQYYLWYFYPK